MAIWCYRARILGPFFEPSTAGQRTQASPSTAFGSACETPQGGALWQPGVEDAAGGRNPRCGSPKKPKPHRGALGNRSNSIKVYYEAFPSRKEAGAFTPLRSAAGGLLGPAFMPGSLTRLHSQSGRVPCATIPAASCRARDKPRIDSASSTERFCGCAVPRPFSIGVWSSTRAQARA